MANPWDNDPVVSRGATVTPIDPYRPREESRKDEDQSLQRRSDARAEQAVGFDRGDRNFDEAQKLRNEFQGQPSVVTYNVALGTYNSSLKTGKNAQGDQSLITSYAKMLDPTSSVREGEFDTTANTQRLADQIKAKFTKEFGGAGGGMLTEEGRSAIRDEMRNLVLNRFKRPYDRDRSQYEKIARTYGIDPYTVVGENAISQYPADLLNPATQESVLSPEQQKIYDTVLASNPNATAEQLNTIFDAAGFPKVENLDEVVRDRDKGLGVTPGSGAVPGSPSTAGYEQSQLGQGLAGVNDGIATTLGLPVDAATWAMNLVPKGINAIANTDIPQIENPFMGSEWFQQRMEDVGASYPENADGSGRFARRVGESVGASVLPAGLAGSGGRVAAALLSGAGGGVGGATAQEIAPDNIYAEIAGELLGGGLTGGSLLVSGKRRAQREIESAIPSTSELKAKAGEQYRAAEAQGMTASGEFTQELSDSLKKTLQADGRVSPTGRISEVYPKAKEAIKLVDDYAGSPMNPTQVQTVRSVLADGLTSTEPTERRIAKLLMNEFDDWADNVVPGLAPARDTASRYLNAGQLEQARELAGGRVGQFTGSGFENALRTEYRKLDRNSITGRGRYGDEVTAAIRDVSRGTPASNIARDLGKFAPTGVVSSGLATGVPFYIGNAVGGPAVGAAASAATLGTGHAARQAATKMGIRNADIAELIARNGGAIDAAPYTDINIDQIIAGLLAAEGGKYLEDDTPDGQQYYPR